VVLSTVTLTPATIPKSIRITPHGVYDLIAPYVNTTEA
jgi:hypothetical protein